MCLHIFKYIYVKSIAARDDFNNGVVSISVVIFLLVLSSFLLLYLFKEKGISEATPLTAYIALLSAAITLYLWLVRERKKERQFELSERIFSTRQDELYQNKVNELNKVFVDAVEQFSESKSLIEGAFSLIALIDSWENLSIVFENNVKEHDIQITKISSILFSKYTMDEKIRDNAIFKKIIGNLFVRIARKTSTTLPENNHGYKFDFSIYDFAKLSIPGTQMQGAVFKGVKLTSCDLRGVHLSNANLRKADLTGSNLRGAKLEDAILLQANLCKVNFRDGRLKGARCQGSNLNNAILKKADFRNVNLSNVSLNEADLTKAKLNGATINSSTLYNSNLTEIRYSTDTSFKHSRISNADLIKYGYEKDDFPDIIIMK